MKVNKMFPTGEAFVDQIDQALQALKELDLFVSTALIGLRHASEATGWLEVSRRLAMRDRDDEANHRLTGTSIEKSSKELETFAKEQGENGQPYLYSIAVVRVWSILEALADDLVLSRFRMGKYDLDADVFTSIKLPIREVINLDQDRQAAFIVNELKQVTRARLQQGVGRFEALLTTVSLGGEIDTLVRQAIFECSQVRNLIAHRNGVVDTRFLKACPWYVVSEGKSLPLERNHFLMYYNAAFWYALEIQKRVSKADQIILADSICEIQGLFLRNLKGLVESR